MYLLVVFIFDRFRKSRLIVIMGCQSSKATEVTDSAPPVTMVFSNQN